VAGAAAADGRDRRRGPGGRPGPRGGKTPARDYTTSPSRFEAALAEEQEPGADLHPRVRLNCG